MTLGNIGLPNKKQLSENGLLLVISKFQLGSTGCHKKVQR